jgi:hypothetical protein
LFFDIRAQGTPAINDLGQGFAGNPQVPCSFFAERVYPTRYVDQDAVTGYRGIGSISSAGVSREIDKLDITQDDLNLILGGTRCVYSIWRIKGHNRLYKAYIEVRRGSDRLKTIHFA